MKATNSIMYFCVSVGFLLLSIFYVVEEDTFRSLTFLGLSIFAVLIAMAKRKIEQTLKAGEKTPEIDAERE